MILWGLDDLQEKQRWVKEKNDEYDRLDAAYVAVQAQKKIYKIGVKSARKTVFKDGWFMGNYDWKGSNYESFRAFGNGDVKTEVDSYYRNESNGLDDVADALLEAKNAILNEITNTFLPKFGPFQSFNDLLMKIGTEIHSLMNG